MDEQLIRIKVEEIMRLAGEIKYYLSTAPAVPAATPTPVPTEAPAVAPVVAPNYPTMTCTLADETPRLFPPEAPWLDFTSLHMNAAYLQGRCWWTLGEMAKAAQVKLAVYIACPMSGVLPGSPAHRPCYGLDGVEGGMMADIGYPTIDGKLNTVAMNAICARFMQICAPKLPPDKEWRDVQNEAEMRMGSDVEALISWKRNRHIQVDDAMHHRFDDEAYPHCHVKFGYSTRQYMEV